MSNDSTHAAATSERSLPAWAISIFFHSSVIALLLRGDPAVAARRRAMQSNHSVGIVLNSDWRGGRAAGRRRRAIGPSVWRHRDAGAAGFAHSTAGNGNCGNQSQRAASATGQAGRRTHCGNARAANRTRQQPSLGKGRSGVPGGQRLCAGQRVRRRRQRQQVRVRVRSVVRAWKARRWPRRSGNCWKACSRSRASTSFTSSFSTRGRRRSIISGGGRRIAFATDRNKQLAANFVGGITADGGTDRMIALREATRLLARRDLLSDRRRRPDVGERNGRNRAGESACRRRRFASSNSDASRRRRPRIF